MARFIAETSYGQLPEGAVNNAKRAVLDCLGVTLAGGEELGSKIIIDYVKGLGERFDIVPRIQTGVEAGLEVLGLGFKPYPSCLMTHTNIEAASSVQMEGDGRRKN